MSRCPWPADGCSVSAKRCSIDGHQGSVFSKDKVTQITRVSASRVEAAVTREGRHLPVPASSAKMEGLGDAWGLCAALILPCREGALSTTSLSAKSSS